MALTGTNIIGRIALPDDTNPVNSVVRFVMTGFDTDDTENATVVPIPINAAIDALGDIDVNLWPNPLGVRSTFYATYVRIPDGNTNDVINVYVGQISVPSTGGPYDLNDLLPIAPPSGKSISFKRGDTFQLEGTRTNRSGAAVNLSGLTISSQARVGSFVDDLTVSITSAATGEFILSATAAETELWPLGNLYCDIQFVGAVTESTETFVIDAIEDITRAG